MNYSGENKTYIMYIRLIITYDTPHSGTMIYAVTLRNSS